MKARTTSDSFQPLMKAYTVQAMTVLKAIAIVPRRVPAAYGKNMFILMELCALQSRVKGAINGEKGFNITKV